MAKLSLWYDDDGEKLEQGDWVTVNGDTRAMVEINSEGDRILKGVDANLVFDSLVKVSDGLEMQ